MNLSHMKMGIWHTLAKPLLNVNLVIDACQILSQKIEQGDYQILLDQIGLSDSLSSYGLSKAAEMLSQEYLLHKMRVELGNDLENPKRFPIGVLLHISAGNMDGLPAYSVIEGLLTGNVNLLKLPEDEPGISSFLLKELIRIEPSLKEYIYVFQISSKETSRIKQLMNLADAIAVWGGDDAVGAVRSLAPPSIPLIQWGHKISFAYVTIEGMGEEALMGLARHMISTKQLLCSSCQGIYLDTDDEQAANQFCHKFLEILVRAAKEKQDSDLGITAQNTLRVYNQQLISSLTQNTRFYSRQGISVRFSPDSCLETSAMFGNCWVKLLPQKQLMSTLRTYNGYLQTVGLLCHNDEWDSLSYQFCRIGAVQIRKGWDMSHISWGDAHDGEYPLRRYSKIIES